MNKTSLSITRRKFLSLAGYSALSLPLAGQRVIGANDRIRVALIGCGGRAGSHAEVFPKLKNVEVIALCDPDTAQMDKLVQRTLKKEIDLSKAKRYVDYRKVYENKDVDVVVISSPNYWHTLHAIQAMEAGKDVYCEKPVSHSVWEGQQLVAAQKKYGRVIAAGFQNRSDPGPIEGIRYVQEGNLGKILSVHACCFRNRESIGPKLSKPLVPPATIDYNLWLGPMQDIPIYRENLHYDWHWVWNTGDGDIGNQCPHEIDMMCWALGDPELPKTMKTIGNRFGWNDAGETPNLHTAWCEMNGVPCIIEVNDLWLAPERNVPGMRDGVRVGIIVRCEGGQLQGGRGGMYTVGEDGKTKIMKFPGNGGESHQQNFIDAVRAGTNAGLRSRIEVAERSSAVAHLTNVSIQAGQEVNESRIRKHIGDDPILNTIVTEQAAQLKNWGISNPQYKMGKNLSINPKNAKVLTEGVEALVRLPNRKEFTVPELI